MKKNKYASIRNGLLAVLLPVLGGCAATSHTALMPAEQPPWGGTDLPAAIAAPDADELIRVEIDDFYAPDTPAPWDQFNIFLFPPDPEHITRETDPVPAAEAPEETWADSVPPTAGGVQYAGKAGAHSPDLLYRMRAGFCLPRDTNQRIQAEFDWYVSHPDYLVRTVERARPYLYIIVDDLERRGMPLEIALLPIVESAFQPFAYSHGRASGIWQFIPSTARHFGLKQNWWYDGRRDILASTRAALDYLQALHDQLDNDWLLALAAYNSGAGTVKRAIHANMKRGKPTDFWSLQLPAETRAYVPKLLALAELFARPGHYSIEIPGIPDEPVVRTAQTGSQIDLAKAAELADMSLDELYRLNPAFNRWATDPEGPHELLLPMENAALLETNLAALDDAERVRWERYIIRQGDTLGTIAQRHHTTVEVLRQFNNIKGSTIRAGHPLIIPVSARDLSGYALSQDQRRKAAQNSVRGGSKFVHSVRSGDTLWDIARKYNVRMNQLAQWNAMSPRDPLRIGQQLTVWRKPAISSARSANDLNQLHPHNNTTKRISYVVRKGDSLALISQRFNVKVSELRNWNSLHKNEYLQPGQKLTLYIDIIDQTENI